MATVLRHDTSNFLQTTCVNASHLGNIIGHQYTMFRHSKAHFVIALWYQPNLAFKLK